MLPKTALTMLKEFCVVTGLDASQQHLLECVVRTAYEEGRIDSMNNYIKSRNNDTITIQHHS